MHSILFLLSYFAFYLHPLTFIPYLNEHTNYTMNEKEHFCFISHFSFSLFYFFQGHFLRKSTTRELEVCMPSSFKIGLLVQTRIRYCLTNFI